jgi:acyl carrier protein
MIATDRAGRLMAGNISDALGGFKLPEARLGCCNLPVMADMERDELVQRVFEILRDELLDAEADFTPRSNLVAAGLDSLAVTQLMLAIEESTGVWVDESLLTEETLASVAALAALVHRVLGQSAAGDAAG